MADDLESTRRYWWVVVVALIACVFGVFRLLLDESVSVLGMPTSCGNAIAWLDGADNGRGASLCGPQLHNASVEGMS